MNRKRKKPLVAAWIDVGNTWARYGRAMGKVALEGIADALKKTAEALDENDHKQEQKSDHHGASDSPAEPTAEKASHE